MTKSENTQPKQIPGRFRKGESGNPAGKPKGARNKATMLVEALLDGEAEALTRTAIQMALGGDPTALRLCLERLLPPRKDRPVCFKLPTHQGRADASSVLTAIMQAVATGELTPGEAGELGKLLEGFGRAIEAQRQEPPQDIRIEVVGV